jgi:hypothetical protein
MARHNFRRGNRALEHIHAHYASTRQLSHLIDSIPTLSSLLRKQAEEMTQRLYADAGLVSRLVGKLSGKSRLFAKCILDLMLVPCFEGAYKYSNDNELASLFIDAVLYEATGCEASTPAEGEVLDEGTQRARGLSKYILGRRLLRVPDVEGWMFGKEYSALLTGSAKDIAYIAAVHPTTILIRGIGKWAVDYCLFGSLPTEADKKALDSLVDASGESLLEIVKSFPGQGQKQP